MVPEEESELGPDELDPMEELRLPVDDDLAADDEIAAEGDVPAEDDEL
jgi:hypothetical protein